jgi:hypothetical protein
MKCPLKRLNVWMVIICFLSIQPVCTQQTTNSALVKNDFAANWSTGVYPRLYTSATELQRFKNLIQAGDEIAVKSWREIRLDAEELLGMGIPDWSQDGRGVIKPIHNLQTYYIPPLAVAYLMTGDKRYADKLWEVAQKMLGYKHWGVNPDSFVEYHYLDTGIAGLNIAIIYDALYNYLTPDQRTQLYSATKRLLFEPGYQGKVMTNHYTNWSAICNGGIVAACLTMFEHDPDYLSDIASRAINNFKPHIDSFNPEGSGKEGYGYWLYGTKSLVTAFDIMKRTLGTTYGNADTYAMKQTGYFPVYFSGPVATLNLGNDHTRSSRSNTLLWFAKYHNDNNLAKLYHDICFKGTKVMPWYDMFNYDPDMVGKGALPDLPLDRFVSGMHVHSFYEKWNDPNAFFVAIHGGPNATPHGHLDAGTFFIQGLGETWAIGNYGPENYEYSNVLSKTSKPDYNDANTVPTTIGGWHYYRNRAESKNCLIFNPDYRPDQYWSGSANTIFFNSEKNQATVALDMKGVYSRDVNSYQRACRLNRVHRVITIQDTYSARENKRVWWNMNTASQIAISSDGQSALLNLNGKQLKAIIRYPHDAKFQALPVTFLDGRTFTLATQSAIGGKKLGICLPSSKDGIIRVDFMPPDAETAQEAIIDDFEGFSYAYSSSSTHGNIVTMADNPGVNIINQSNMVLKFSVNGAVQSIPSLISQIRSFVAGDGAGQFNSIKIKVRSGVAASFRLQLTNGKDNTSSEFTALTGITQTNTWQELTFNLSKDIYGQPVTGKLFDGIRLTPVYEVSGNAVSFYLDDLMLINKTLTAIPPKPAVSGLELFRYSDGLQLIATERIMQVEVFSVSGIKISDVQPKDNQCLLSLASGKIHLLRVHTENAVVVKKVFYKF